MSSSKLPLMNEPKTNKINSPDFPREIPQNRQLFELLVHSVKDYAIFMLDPKGYVMTWNEGAQRIKGYTREDIIGKHFSIFYTDEAREIGHPQAELKIAAQEGKYEEEGWRVRKDGSFFWASVTISAVFDEGKLLGFAKVTRDLTERKLAEQQREASARLLADANIELKRALEAKSQFLSTISHEVRTPMSGVIGLTELLTLQDLGDDNNKIVSTVFDSCKRLLQLLNNFLDSARMQSGKLLLEYREFPPRAVLGDVRQLVASEAEKKNLSLLGYCDERIPEFLCGDEMRLRQVLLNLVDNAVKFTATGEITVSCDLARESDGIVVAKFAVKDQGIGIKPEHIEGLFKPFSQAEQSTARRYGGTGLGLSICKELVELMDGKIGVESEFGKGTTFWFEVPFSKDKCRI